MNVEVTSQEVHYSITFDELCNLLKIPSTKEIDFIDLTIDTNKETITLSQIEPTYVKRPKGDNEKQ